jgi:hypothetical protein
MQNTFWEQCRFMMHETNYRRLVVFQSPAAPNTRIIG